MNTRERDKEIIDENFLREMAEHEGNIKKLLELIIKEKVTKEDIKKLKKLPLSPFNLVRKILEEVEEKKHNGVENE
jgi:translation initiation factor 2 beta subunit (eIF-2beta)/eIF-5